MLLGVTCRLILGFGLATLRRWLDKAALEPLLSWPGLTRPPTRLSERTASGGPREESYAFKGGSAESVIAAAWLAGSGAAMTSDGRSA